MTVALKSLAPCGVLGIARQHLLLTFSVVISFAVFMTAHYLRSPWRKLPPGPRGLPFLGNALQLRNQQWLTFMRWKHEFGTRSRFPFDTTKICLIISSGDVFYLNAAGQPIVVLNTQKTAADLLDRRAAIYSDRPRNIVAAQILCGGLAITFQNYGPLCAYFLIIVSFS